MLCFQLSLVCNVAVWAWKRSAKLQSTKLLQRELFSVSDSKNRKKSDIKCLCLHCVWSNVEWQRYSIQRNLTSDFLVYNDVSVEHHKAASILNLLVYSQIDPVLSVVRSLIWELKSDEHNLDLWFHNSSTCSENEIITSTLLWHFCVQC